MIVHPRTRRWLAGSLWILLWTGVLWLVAAPWRDLGGVVDEWLRWMEAVVLLSGLILGFTLGRYARDYVLEGWGRTWARCLRWLLYPAAFLAAFGLVVLTALGERGPVGVIVSALLAYWAGLDLAFGAVPLMEGKSFRWNAPLDRER